MKCGFLAICALICWILHGYHVNYMFENDRHFSHLSELERELSFRSEMGLYFSYYKILIESPSITKGLERIKNDNFTEYPNTINTLQRFNLYPEVGIAILYRLFNYTTNKYLKMNLVECWWISRGEYSSVKSCIGLGNPTYFYVLVVTIIAGSTTFSLFYLGYLLSNSFFGALFVVLQFFFNHTEATRVMWTIPLRESFGYPLFIFQTLLVTYVLKHGVGKNPKAVSTGIVLSTVALIVSWQFGPFILFTQLLSLYLVHLTSREEAFRHTLLRITFLHVLALSLSWVLMFRNRLLVTSLYSSCLIATLVLENGYANLLTAKLTSKPFLGRIVSGLLYLSCIVLTKFASSKLLNNQDDNHVFEILLSKFTSYRNFHTMLYTCSPEFDFLGKDTLLNLTRTLLLPSNAIVIVLYAIQLLNYLRTPKVGAGVAGSPGEETKRGARDTTGGGENGVDPGPRSNGCCHQTCPTSCDEVVNANLHPELYKFPGSESSRKSIKERGSVPTFSRALIRSSLLVSLLAASSYTGLHNLRKERDHSGEYLNLEQEDMMNWILANTLPGEAFAGPMPIMANVKLSTGRPIVNHPHYEDANLRARTKLVYSLFSRKPQREVHAALTNLSATYAVVEDNWCIYQSRDECTLPAIWDMEDDDNRFKKPVCISLRRRGLNNKYFTSLYSNMECSILRINKVKP